MLNYFDSYVSIGLQPIPVYRNSKQPIGMEWNRNWSVNRWRNFFELKGDEYNIGILLGQIVDVEADTEEANELLEHILDDTPHPAFESNRSIHHLFLTPDINLTVSKIKGIEFRGNKVFSVVPPSIHESGNEYQFLKNSKFPVPEMPKGLRNYYWQNKKIKLKNNKIILKDGHKRTICNICRKKKFIHKKRLILEVRAFRKYNLLWSCQDCRTLDLREDCRKIRSFSELY